MLRMIIIEEHWERNAKSEEEGGREGREKEGSNWIDEYW